MSLKLLRQLLIDRYYSSELIEKLGIPIDELVDCLWEYIKDNIDKFDDEFKIDEELYK